MNANKPRLIRNSCKMICIHFRESIAFIVIGLLVLSIFQILITEVSEWVYNGNKEIVRALSWFGESQALGCVGYPCGPGGGGNGKEGGPGGNGSGDDDCICPDPDNGNDEECNTTGSTCQLCESPPSCNQCECEPNAPNCNDGGEGCDDGGSCTGSAESPCAGDPVVISTGEFVLSHTDIRSRSSNTNTLFIESMTMKPITMFQKLFTMICS